MFDRRQVLGVLGLPALALAAPRAGGLRAALRQADAAGDPSDPELPG